MRKAIFLAFSLSTSTLAFGAEPVKVTPPQQNTLSAGNGRYVFGQVSEYRRDQYMLDTQTGRLWQMAESKVGESTVNVLQPVFYTSPDGKYSVSPK